MKKKRVLISGIAAIIVIVTGITLVIRQTMTTVQPAEKTEQEHVGHGPATEPTSALYRQFAALKGEAYDEAFIGDMIVHHEGAVNMAELAMAQAARQEIKDLAAAIVSSQSKEIPI